MIRSFLKKIVSPFLKKASAIYLLKARKFTYKDISVMVEPTVFPPFITISTKLLLDFVDSLELKNQAFLELGCGCGIISILAAQKGAVVTATDINTVALDALKINALKNGASIDIIYSDLFENLEGKNFNYIVINPPYYPKQPLSIAENAWYCGEDFEYFKKLFAEIPAFITEDNNIFMILSEDCELAKIIAIASVRGIYLNPFLEKKVMSEKNFIFKLSIEKNS